MAPRWLTFTLFWDWIVRSFGHAGADLAMGASCAACSSTRAYRSRGCTSTHRLAPDVPGTYRVWLWIPDPDLLELLDRLDQPDAYPLAQVNYAVKLATKRDNQNVFDDTTGENDLGISIKDRSGQW